MKNMKKVLGAAVLLGLAAAYLTADESTKRYLIHIGKQAHHLAKSEKIKGIVFSYRTRDRF